LTFGPPSPPRLDAEALKSREILARLSAIARGDLGVFLVFDQAKVRKEGDWHFDIAKARRKGLTRIVKKLTGVSTGWRSSCTMPSRR
jgi:hypothetical protein